jgi:glycosyltransferase involved in cell wall biosynthesis
VNILGVFDKLGELFVDRTHLLGGAEQTAIAYLEGLTRRYGHTGVVATPFPVRRRRRYGQLEIESFRDTEELKEVIRRVKPRLLMSNLGLVYDTVRLAQGLGLANVALLDSYEYCEPSREDKVLGRLSLTREYPSATEAAFAVRGATKVFVPSKYLARMVHARYGVRPAVLYPPLDLGPVKQSRQTPPADAFITGICGLPHKGADIFDAVCRAFPNERFLLLGRVDPSYRDRFAALPNLTVIPRLSTAEFLQRTRILVVPSQWEEPFGRVAVEGMALGIPTLASLCGGLAEIVGTSPLGVARFRDVDAWTRALDRLLTSAAARRLNATVGRTRSRRFEHARSVGRLQTAIASMRPKRRRAIGSRRIAVVGGASEKTAYALINQRILEGLPGNGRAVLSRAAVSEPGAGAIDAWIHHDYSVNFVDLVPPSEGKWIAVRPWDFGPFPSAWAKKIGEECDQLWVPSRWSKRMAVDGGISAARVKVIPWGIDEAIFTPEGPKYPLPTNKRCIFLFVGAPIYRKGTDLLLKAYVRAFSASDDVCLVVKCHRKDVFYDGLHVIDQIRAIQSDPASPSIVVMDQFTSASELAALYRACTVGVFPYRAEGFCLPILEAMASGAPSIVPAFGPCLDYCTQESSFLVPATRIALPLAKSFQFNTLGFEEFVEAVDFCEVPVDRLAQELRTVYELPDGVIRDKSRRGVTRSHAHFRWRDCLDRMGRALDTLTTDRVPVRLAARRRAARADFETFQVARALFLEARQPR